MHLSFSRRTLLTTGALAAVSTVTPRLAPAQPSKPAIRLGIASYTFRSFDRATMIGFLKQLEITSINPKDIKDHLPAEPAGEDAALAAYKAAGIDLHAAGAIYFPKDEDADMRAKFEYCKRAGIRVIVAGDPTPAMLPRLEKFIKEYDIKIALHNHGPEDKLWPSPLDILKAVAPFDQRLGCCIDVGHTVRAGTDVVAAIRAVAPRLHNVHMKDLTSFTDKASRVAVGRGKMPIREIFNALTAINYPGYVDLEYEVHADNPMPGVIESLAYMRGILAGMARVAF